jgi:hypothetical protein
LHEHPADGGGGVERFGGGDERDADLIEFGEQVQQVGQSAGEPVDAVDEQHVVAVGLGRAQRSLQAGPVGGGSRRRRRRTARGVRPIQAGS